MSLRIGVLGAAHVHTGSYVACFQSNPRTSLSGVWDRDAKTANRYGVPTMRTTEALLAESDAVVICSENVFHAELTELAARHGKHILCEKPVITSPEDDRRMQAALDASNVKFMTAFPCRFSAAYARLKQRVQAGDIGEVKAICATNRGQCPGGWFVQYALSRGGAMIDHVVHVGDLLRDLLQCEVKQVYAATGNNIYGKDWEDTALLTLEFENGVFATLDSSWSRPKSYKTWGDVTMNVVGERGVIELDMFGQDLEHFGAGHGVVSFASNCDAAMTESFVSAILDGTPIVTTYADGVAAAKIALLGYESARQNRAVSA